MTGWSPGHASSVIHAPAAPLRGKTSFSKYGVAFARTCTVSPGMCGVERGLDRGEVATRRRDDEGRGRRAPGDEQQQCGPSSHGMTPCSFSAPMRSQS